ncbi:MAG: Tetratricopeptide repeat-containing protein [Labilithrix sp.]|nr:Tetratricopeptide repeat-containing protein [Labilithrix sp.]
MSDTDPPAHDDDAVAHDDDAAGTLVEGGEAHLYDGDYAGARRLFAKAVAVLEQLHGPDAPDLIAPLMGLARATGENNASASPEIDQELAVQTRALAIAEKSLDADDPLLAEVLHAHGVSTWASGRAAEGVALLERALAVARAAGLGPASYIAPLLGALLDARRADDTLPHARELLALEAASGGAADLTTLFVVGQCFREAGALAEARAVFERFLAAWGEEGNPVIREQVEQWLAELSRPAS